MKVTICIGSSCHVKGSRQVIEELQGQVEQNSLGGKVELAGAFCMNNCQEGVCVTVDGAMHSVEPKTAKAFFDREILAKA